LPELFRSWRAWLPLSAGLFLLLITAAPSPGAGPEAADASRTFGLLISPKSVKPGDTLRVLAAFETAPRDVRISVTGPSGHLSLQKTRRGDGPPFWRAAEFRIPGAGRYTIIVTKDGRPAGTADLDVPSSDLPAKRTRGVWESVRGWTRADENLYAAWLEALFLGTDERSSWPFLHEAVDDPERNLLFDHLGLGEDDPGGPNRVEMTPDCADNPFFLRAYFAWKTGLPFGFFESSWGTLDSAPRGLRWWTNESWSGGGGNPVGAFRRMLPFLKDTVHAGNGRMEFKAEQTDYYPVSLTRQDLRPGVVFADPYGHTLTIVRWVPQTAKTPGQLLAVDAQPDGTIGIKRFWQGNFLFNTKDVVGEPGFKAFRPIVLTGGGLRLLTNEEIRQSPDYGNYSLEQRKMASDAFYAAMENLINPDPLDAEGAFRDLINALHEQLIVRIVSVANGEKHMASHPGTVIPMPAGGAAVFQTTGPWEDFSTPNRDLRLLIAIDTVLGFPEKVAKNPRAFGIPESRKPERVKAGLLALQKKWSGDLAITYIRSDGTPQALMLEEIFAREEAFEMGYNPNDGVEIRWGAPPGSAEMAACRRHAPAYQVERMKALRRWFQMRLHPST
jgi:hypothetical protein